jgi:hypothetical protein
VSCHCLFFSGLHPGAPNKASQTAYDIAKETGTESRKAPTQHPEYDALKSVATGNLPAMLSLQKHIDRVLAESNLAMLRCVIL